jgi:hypothetical protein
MISEKKRIRCATKRDMNMGWSFDYWQVKDVADTASHMEQVSMEQAESVIAALIDLGYMEQPEEP